MLRLLRRGPPAAYRLSMRCAMSESATLALTMEQSHVADRIIKGSGNILITGSAGTGKTFLLRHIIAALRREHSHAAIAVTAATGVAAMHIQGTTLNSFAGIGFGVRPGGSVEQLLQKVKRDKKVKANWKTVTHLIIDEISMIDSDTFSLLDRVCRALKKRSKLPFGGVRLILCGDFFQLPPVSLGHPSWPENQDTMIDMGQRKRFAFECETWKEASIEISQLLETHRHHEDMEFADILREFRLGSVSPGAIARLQECHVDHKPSNNEDGIEPSHLYCRNIDVDNENKSRLDALPGDVVTVTAHDSWIETPDVATRWDAEAREVEAPPAAVIKSAVTAIEKVAPSVVCLKVGAQVMLTKNDHRNKLVNGSRGVVLSFFGGLPNVRFDNGVALTIEEAIHEIPIGPDYAATLRRFQIPLKLAWALTVHKSQGSTISKAEIMISDAFAFGQVYVALSRVKSMKGLWIRGGEITKRIVKVHPEVLKSFGDL